MNLIDSICPNVPAFRGSGGPAEATRQLRQFASEIESNVANFAACQEAQRIAGSRHDCSCIAYLADQ